MTRAQLETIEELFHSALNQAPEQRATFLDSACAGDEQLRSQVESLLASHERAGGFIETSPLTLASKILEGASPESLIGQRFGHFELLKQIGAGGMGDVYLATDLVAGRKAALKLLPLHFTSDPHRLQRFKQEARVVVALNHPNIVTVYEIGENDSTHYIASELIEGETLRQRLTRGPLALDEALEIAIQVASALSATHEAGIVHRDIKPENIMLRPDGYVKVLDFGIAKLAEPQASAGVTIEESRGLLDPGISSIAGTTRYMSPEQLRGEPVTHSSDIWSLGVVCYEMVTGRSPFAATSSEEVIKAILTEEPAPLTSGKGAASVALQPVISRMLRKPPGQRQQSARELVSELKAVRRQMELRTAPRPSRRFRAAVAAVIALLVAAAGIGFFFQLNPKAKPPPDKSIAVLPFESLSKDPQNAYFAAAVEDEILTNLAQIADLKVISRTSSHLYEIGKPRNSRQIGEELGVTHLLEGNVQRIANRVRINVQLIDARSDSHVWAQVYDREVTDLFALQSEIAQTIATQLQAKISERERASLRQPPTTDLEANAFYSRALALEPHLDEPGKVTEATVLLERAVKRDPQFVLAFCGLARTHLMAYLNGFDRGAARLEMARTALAKAAALRPDEGEVHLVRARYLAFALRDYDKSREELELARRVLPNSPAVYSQTAMIDRRQGRIAEAIWNYERAAELDPRNVDLLVDLASTYSGIRRYREAIERCRRAIAISPRAPWPRVLAAEQIFRERAETAPIRQTLESIIREDPKPNAMFAGRFFEYAIYGRDAEAASRALAAIPPEGFAGSAEMVWPKAYFAGLAARVFQGPEAGRLDFEQARRLVEQTTRQEPDNAAAWSLLGLIDAFLGRKEEAIKAGRHACDLLPLSREPVAGVRPLSQLARIYALTGETEAAIEILAAAADRFYGCNYGDLKLAPEFDRLRGDPGFEKIVASLAPKGR